MNHSKTLWVSGLLALALVLSCICGSVTLKADEMKMLYSTDDEAFQALQKELVISDTPDTLSAEEHELGYNLYYPLGVKFLMPEAIKDSENIRQRKEGNDSTKRDLVYMSRAYYYRSNAAVDKEKEYKEMEDKAEKAKLMKELAEDDRPLFAFFVLREKKIPESEEELAEKLGFAHLERLNAEAENGLVRYFATAEPNMDGLSEEDVQAYQELYESIVNLRASMSGFPAQKPEESFLKLGKWDLDAKTLDGDRLDASYWEQAKGTIVMYWVTWCPDCAEQMQIMQGFQEDMQEMGIQFLGVVSDLMEEDPDQEIFQTAQEKIANSGLAPDFFTNVYNNMKMETELFKRCYNYPTLILVNSDGEIERAIATGVAAEPAKVKWLIQNLLTIYNDKMDALKAEEKAAEEEESSEPAEEAQPVAEAPAPAPTVLETTPATTANGQPETEVESRFIGSKVEEEAEAEVPYIELETCDCGK